VISLVKIHGNWCGPNWTGGQRVAAEDYTGPWDGPAISPLDEACRSHDFSCSKGGCTRAAHTALIRAADRRILKPDQAFLMQLKLANPFLSRSERKRIEDRLTESSDAALVSAGIEIARLFTRK
jgi:hypothetical protein